MDNREAIEYINWMRDKFITDKPLEACDLAISALEKQEQTVDKCCETCKYELLELDAYPCCDCIRAKDHYEPYTEEEA